MKRAEVSRSADREGIDLTAKWIPGDRAWVRPRVRDDQRDVDGNDCYAAGSETRLRLTSKYR
jgi:hypothetical protein